MSVHINGLKLLESNHYDKMAIIQNDDEYRIKVTGENNPYLSKTSNDRIKNNIKEKDDKEKVIHLVKDFLEYSSINSIGEEYKFRYDNAFIVAKGSRELCISVAPDGLEMIPKLVIDKFCSDRVKFCEENKDIKKYDLFFDHLIKSSYVKRKLLFNNTFTTKIELNFHCNFGKMSYFDESFFNNFIYEKLYEEGQEAIVEEKYVKTIYDNGDGDDYDYVNCGHYLECGELSMRIWDNNLLPYIYNTVNKYNEERKVAKKMQLKLEGF